MSDKKYIIAGIDVHEFGSSTLYGIHGFMGSATDKPVNASPGLAHCTGGYMTRRDINESKFVIEYDEKTRRREVTTYLNKDPILFLQPECYLEGNGILSHLLDEEQSQLESALKITKILLNLDMVKASKDDALSVKIYHSLSYVERGIVNIGTKRMRNNIEVWEELYGYLESHRNIEWIFSPDYDEGRGIAISERAGNIANLGMVSHDIPFNTDTFNIIKDKGYWKVPKKLPNLIAYRELCFYTGDDHDRYKEYNYIVNRGQTLYNIGKKSTHCGYGVVKLNSPEKTVNTLIDGVAKDNTESTFYSLRLDTLYSPVVHRDFNRYGKDMYTRDTLEGVFTSIHNKPLLHVGNPVGVILRGVNYLGYLRELLDVYSGDLDDKESTIEIVGESDVTSLFYSKNDKGKTIATDLLKESVKQIKLPLVESKRQRIFLLGSELPSRNHLVRMANQEPKITMITFQQRGVFIKRVGFVIETTEGKGVFTNWFLGIVYK